MKRRRTARLTCIKGRQTTLTGFVEYLKRLLFYGGVDKNIYREVRGDIQESNRTYVIDYCLIAGVGMLLMFVLSFFIPVLESSRKAYLVVVIVSVCLLLIAMGPAKKYPMLTTVSMYVFTSLLLAFGIILGTVVEPNQASASFGILLFAVPLLFTDIPIFTNLQLLFAIAVYLIAAKTTQSEEMFQFNASIVLPYGAVSMILCVLMMRIKIIRQALHYQNRILVEKDQLTGMLNRRSFEKKLQSFTEEGCPEGTVFCAFDVDGLKKVNDTQGHAAGDELLVAAARGIEQVYGRYGVCYRTGGDEFYTIIEGEHPDLNVLEKELTRYGQQYQSPRIPGLSISVGTAVYKPGDSVEETANTADGAMYACKRTKPGCRVSAEPVNCACGGK